MRKMVEKNGLALSVAAAVFVFLVGLFAIAAMTAPTNAESPAGDQVGKNLGLRKLVGLQLGASGQVVTSVNKSFSPSPTQFFFSALSKSITSSAESVFGPQIVAASTTSGLLEASGTGSMQLLYAYSTTLDGTLSIYGNTAGTGAAAASVTLTSGVPYMWDNVTSGTTALNLTTTSSIAFQAGTTSGGLASSSSATTFTAASLYP